jgi:mannose-6-phosphate isomerase-like protein (cupin superfamily)
VRWAGGADGSRRLPGHRRTKPIEPRRFVQRGEESKSNVNIQTEKWSEDSAPVASELKQRLQSEGYSVFQCSDAPGTKYGPHAHGEDQSHWIVSGELELRVGHEIYTLRAGDRDFLPANTIHSAFVPGNEPVVYLIGAKH